MAFNFMKKKQVRSDPGAISIEYVSPTQFIESISDSYVKLADNPEVRMGVERIVDMVSSMTIQLMKNSEKGDTRIFNDLSRVVDIEPNPYMTRKNFIAWIVRTLLIEGGGNAVVKPVFDGLKLRALLPVPPNAMAVVLKPNRTYQMPRGWQLSEWG